MSGSENGSTTEKLTTMNIRWIYWSKSNVNHTKARSGADLHESWDSRTGIPRRHYRPENPRNRGGRVRLMGIRGRNVPPGDDGTAVCEKLRAARTSDLPLYATHGI